MHPELMQEAVAEFGFGGFCICKAKTGCCRFERSIGRKSAAVPGLNLFVWNEIPVQFRDNIQRAHVILVNARSS
ncbi:MAG: hypothetical protein LZF63_10440 [Nitrosomonas sp.]|nr:hypothetical protein [Nitrosomonas sp.]